MHRLWRTWRTLSCFGISLRSSLLMIRFGELCMPDKRRYSLLSCWLPCKSTFLLLVDSGFGQNGWSLGYTTFQTYGYFSSVLECQYWTYFLFSGLSSSVSSSRLLSGSELVRPCSEGLRAMLHIWSKEQYFTLQCDVKLLGTFLSKLESALHVLWSMTFLMTGTCIISLDF